jgi:hypothetical protein
MKEKEIERLFWTIITSMALVVLVTVLTGCASPYRAAGISQLTVSAAMHAWDAYVAVKHPSAAIQLKVKAAYEKWQIAQFLVIDAAQTYSAKVGTPGVWAEQEKLEATINAAAQAAADLVALLEPFGIKSGSWSTVEGGYNSTTSGSWATVAGGSGNSATECAHGRE